MQAAMLAKRILCEVESSQRDAFSSAQEKWAAISGAPGLLGQLGGWDEKKPGSAFLLSLWRDRACYDKFMDEIHDIVVGSSSQARTYSHITVDFFSSLLPMPGECGDLIDAIPHARLLRVADCTVKSNRVAHFREAQQDIWIPEMRRAKGMLGGSFHRGENGESRRFLVASLWDSWENHAAYAQNKVPELRKRAGVEADLENIAGRLVRLVPAWQVLPSGR